MQWHTGKTPVPLANYLLIGKAYRITIVLLITVPIAQHYVVNTHR